MNNKWFSQKFGNKGGLIQKQKFWKPSSAKKYIANKFQKMALLLGSICIMLILPNFAFAAEFEIAQCSGNSCTTVPYISTSASANQTVTFRISIKNPEQTPIYSVTSWLKYNPQVWEVVSLSDDSSDFELAAPGEFKAKSDTGEIRIGRAVAGTPITSPSSIVADITLKSKKDPTLSTLQWMDFMNNDIGKTAIVTLLGTTPKNILSQKPNDISFSANNFSNTNNNNQNTNNTISQNNTGINSVRPNANTTSTSKPSLSQTQLQNPAMKFVNIARPTGLRSRTHEDGSVDHLWQMGTDSRIAGYYLYYSTSSGTYMHRRDVGKTNIYQFPIGFFEKGKRVYFAIQAYTSGKDVSDFSDETYLVTGTVGSESHPFFEQIFPNAQNIASDANGVYYQNENEIQENQNQTQNNQNMQADISGNSSNKPNQNTKSGTDIPPSAILLLAGVCLLVSRKLIIS